MPRVTSNAIVMLLLAVLIAAGAMGADTPKDSGMSNEFIPKLGQFPPPGMTGHYFAGELVGLDPINRRGAIRLDGDLDDNRYHSAPSFQFALLPYGSLKYQGAPAELRDFPIGTHVNGYFFLPPEGDTTIPPPKGDEKYVPKFNHAILLEDDFSFYQRQGQGWKVLGLELKYDASSKQFPPKNKGGDWKKTPVSGLLKVVSTGSPGNDGLKGEKSFEIDRSTRLWRGRESIQWEDLAPEAAWTLKDGTRSLSPEKRGELQVQVALTWAPDWKNGKFQAADLWLDDESRSVATERQRQLHLRHQHYRWLAGWVDHVEHQENGRGIVTVTLFGGMDPSLYEEVRAKKNNGVALAAGEPTLRTWWQEHDNKFGPVVELKDLPNPPPGSSGLQLRVQINDLLEGYRPGRIVRMRPNDWPNVKLPPEERVKSMEDR